MDSTATMKAMVLEGTSRHLVERELPIPRPSKDQVLIKISACGICRTDIHIIDNELPRKLFPTIPGHEIVGTVVEKGANVAGVAIGDRIGVPWLAYTCGTCYYCTHGKENLCDNPLFTGYTAPGGFAQYTTAFEGYTFKIPARYSDVNAAPLLCAGLIGYRSFMMLPQPIRTLGIYGFGAAAHIITQLACMKGVNVYAFTRPDDETGRKFAYSLGAVWAGGSDMIPPVALDGAIIFAPVGALVPRALEAVRKGGCVVCGGIYMTDIPSFPYALLWQERRLVSVANLLRSDGEAFLREIADHPVETRVTGFPLARANDAVDKIRKGAVDGAAVLVMDTH